MAGRLPHGHPSSAVTYQDTMEKLLNASLAKSTRDSYSAQLTHFHQFISPATMPVEMPQVLCFVAYLFDAGYSAPSIATHLSAIAYAHKMLGAPDPT